MVFLMQGYAGINVIHKPLWIPLCQVLPNLESIMHSVMASKAL